MVKRPLGLSKCPHFLGPRVFEGVLVGSKRTEKTKVRGQVVDMIITSPLSQGGDRGSIPLGTANT